MKDQNPPLFVEGHRRGHSGVTVGTNLPISVEYVPPLQGLILDLAKVYDTPNRATVTDLVMIQFIARCKE